MAVLAEIKMHNNLLKVRRVEDNELNNYNTALYVRNEKLIDTFSP